MRGGDTVTITNLTQQSTIHDVKTQYAQKSGQQQEKIKLLLNKKPAADLKTLQELGVDGESVELSVMIMGGGGSGTPSASSPAVEKSNPVPSAPSASAPDSDKMDVDSQGAKPGIEKSHTQMEGQPEAKANSTVDTLKSDAFWADLKTFLAQRLQDDGEGERLAKLFREALGKS
jgi:ubiquitin-like protein 4